MVEVIPGVCTSGLPNSPNRSPAELTDVYINADMDSVYFLIMRMWFALYAYSLPMYYMHI